MLTLHLRAFSLSSSTCTPAPAKLSDSRMPENIACIPKFTKRSSIAKILSHNGNLRKSKTKGRLQTLSPNRILSLVAQLTIISIGMITIRSIIIITTMIMVMIMIIIIIILMITTIRKEKRLWQAVATMRKLGLKSAPSIGRLLWVLNGFLARGTLPFYERILFCVMVSTSPKTFPRLCVLLVPRSHPLVVGIPCATNPTFRPAGVLSCGVRGRNLVAQNGSPDFQLVVEHRCLRYSCLRHLRMNPKGYQTTSTRINLHCKHHFIRYISCIWVGSYHPFLAG